MLDRNENSVTGNKEDGQDVNEEQGVAVRTISDLGQGDGGVLDESGNMVRAIRGMKSVSGQMLGAMRQVADTLTEDSWRGLSGTRRNGLGCGYKCVSGRLVHGCR